MAMSPCTVTVFESPEDEPPQLARSMPRVVRAPSVANAATRARFPALGAGSGFMGLLLRCSFVWSGAAGDVRSAASAGQPGGVVQGASSVDDHRVDARLRLDERETGFDPQDEDGLGQALGGQPVV